MLRPDVSAPVLVKMSLLLVAMVFSVVKVYAGPSKVAEIVLRMARLFSLIMHVASAAGDLRMLAMATAYTLLLILSILPLILAADTGGVANCLATYSSPNC